ncbi:MAG: 2-dehydropantoate 2-reductase [Trueperaceae bacterium]|nr:MAG: 2-dehydropantoate 2-reductase [Trueperaceae bacterium]
MRLAVVGAGAIGGTIGAYLVRAGHDVTFVDVVGEHVAAMRTNGLRIEGPIDAFTVETDAFAPTEVRGRFDTVLLCVKAQATRAAAEDLERFLSADGCVVSLQNGLNELVIEAVVGRERTVGCFVNFGADYAEPGVIHFGGRGALVLGELDGSVTPRLEALTALLRDFDPAARATRNIWGYLWSKLAVGTMIFATALTDEGIADCYDEQRYRRLFTSIAREVLAIALANGVEPEPFDGFDPAGFLPGAPEERAARSLDAMVAFNRRSAKTHSGVWRDLAVRHRKTEAEAQLGPIIERAHALGCPAPLTVAIATQIAQVEGGERARSFANLDELLSATADGIA